MMVKENKLQEINKGMAFHTFKNASVSIVLAILMIVFQLVRTGLTSSVFGVDSLGLLTIVVGILPYINSSHNAMVNVSTAKLYSSIHHKNYAEANRNIANLKPQYYLFGLFYFSIIMILSFAFPFIANSNGTITVASANNIKSQIPWYESTLFILSNGVELIATYFIIPITVILLFITNKSYVYNGFNIIITILINSIIIMFYVLMINKVINLSFVEMSIITTCLLGSKMIILLIILIPYKIKYFSWYKKQKPDSYKLSKDSVQSMFSAYLNQFSSDIISILLLIYAALSTEHEQLHPRHAGPHGGTEIANFIPSAIYSSFLLLITSGHEIVHSIVDASIPSVAEHASFNGRKINRHFFHRYQVLSVYIACFTSSTYIITSPFLQSLLLDETLHDEKVLNMVVALLWIPFVVDIFISMYGHILSIFGQFSKILYINGMKACFTLIFISIPASLIFSLVDQSKWIYGIFGLIICATLVANIICYFIAKKECFAFIKTDACIKVGKSTSLCFIWVLLSLILTLSFTILMPEKIFHLRENNLIYLVILIPSIISILNIAINLINIMLFRKYDFLYYVNEIKSSLKTNNKKIIFMLD